MKIETGEGLSRFDGDTNAIDRNALNIEVANLKDYVKA